MTRKQFLNWMGTDPTQRAFYRDSAMSTTRMTSESGRPPPKRLFPGGC